MKLVEIHWIDSVGHARGGWFDPDSLEDTDMTIQTFGWLVEETDNGYIVASSRMIDNDTVYAPLKIPKVAVTGFWVIELI
jgi:hypothetical protein